MLNSLVIELNASWRPGKEKKDLCEQEEMQEINVLQLHKHIQAHKESQRAQMKNYLVWWCDEEQ